MVGGFLDLHEIQQLVTLVKDANLHELEIERENMRLRIVNQGGWEATHPHVIQSPNNAIPAIVREDKVSQMVNSEDDSNYHIIKSPIVGTFYSAPSPESQDFVYKDSSVDTETTVCIIEAMKVMNEIQAEVKGVIREIFVQNGQPVEFGQPLFKVKRS
ncbi:MAG: acetyl-CoA carboxylase biotin carboxyl carrier protein [Puniceicoccales bacterium]|jgi:acetyl-CoA carboxylase biotin carboxyl carrier protein|nr:acetyl-CoA carboxylase biotin carboxyl carrier protein [Puniceicoccales bacterium]